jgi:hypothetical protein
VIAKSLTLKKEREYLMKSKPINSQIKSYRHQMVVSCELAEKKHQKRTFMQANPGIKEEIYALVKYLISLQ